MSHRSLFFLGLAAVVGSFMACSASNGGGGSDFGSGGSGQTGTGDSSTTVTTSTGDDLTTVTVGSGGSTGSGSSCSTPAGVDDDGDGFSEDQGDCNDCDPNVNPGAIEVPTDMSGQGGAAPEPADEDCDGQIDNVLPTCDDNLSLTDSDPNNGARAIDLCQFVNVNDPNDKKWGVLSAKYVRADGPNSQSGPVDSMQYGIFDSFGPNVHVQGGKRMLSLSSGYARRPSDAGNCGSNTCYTSGAGLAPQGFPQQNPNCFGSDTINDDVALEVVLRSPKNATGYTFNFDFYSFEYPEWVCTSFNDQYITLVTPPPPGLPQGNPGNISFDSQNNPVSVNIAFFDVCAGCALGTSQLDGTGFCQDPAFGGCPGGFGDDAGATGWLATTAPITGGDQVTLRFAIWDTGDQAWDSTVLVDNFQWIANGGTVAVGTNPVEDPK